MVQEDKMNKLILRRIGMTGLVILSIAALALAAAYIIYPPQFVNRMLRWGDADVLDYQKFPERILETSGDAFEFSLRLEEDRVRAQFEAVGGMDDFDRFLEENRTQAFLVIQDDAILYEQYFNGTQRESIVTSFSTAKSFTSALIGIAIAEGHIQSVNDPITEYLPELKERDPAFAAITIRDLLMMSSGIRYSPGAGNHPHHRCAWKHLSLQQLSPPAVRVDPGTCHRHHGCRLSGGKDLEAGRDGVFGLVEPR
jgi:hypothetical protein